jgi:hypothetical protein
VSRSEVDRPSWAPTEVDMSRPSVARVYDYYLGGSHNFESDRAFGDQAILAMPGLPSMMRDNRDFLRRVVRHLCAAGVDQFLDLGSGIPTAGNVHEVASAACPDARTVYVDHDPVAVAHSRALLAGEPAAAVVHADARRPAAVLAAARATGLLDLDRPVAVLMIALLHFVHDEDGPVEIVRGYTDALVPGSHLAISHGRLDGEEAMRGVARVYSQDRSPNAVRLRTESEVAALFGTLTMVEPGLVLMPRWRPDPVDDRIAGAPVGDDYPVFAGLARRD